MSVAHIMAAGMGGIRTAGDLVAWMQLTQRMKITEAKEYVARKLGISVIELTDEEVMHHGVHLMKVVVGKIARSFGISVTITCILMTNHNIGCCQRGIGASKHCLAAGHFK